jgi:hypothetical protein
VDKKKRKKRKIVKTEVRQRYAGGLTFKEQWDWAMDACRFMQRWGTVCIVCNGIMHLWYSYRCIDLHVWSRSINLLRWKVVVGQTQR